MTLKEAKAFLEAGGVLTLADWREMTNEERAYFAFANRKVQTKRLLMSSKADTPMGQLEVYAEVDGGQAHKEAVLMSMAQQIKAERNA